MSQVRKSIAIFLAGIPFAVLRTHGASPPSVPRGPEPVEPLQLRPLNLDRENLFAQHRSHSSHGSHRSSSGGGYAAPQPRTPPQPTPGRQFVPPANNFSNQGQPSSQPVDPGRAAAVSPNPAPAPASKPVLTTAEKRKLQIIRVQIALTSLGLYAGAMDGVLNQKTQEALMQFQAVKGYPSSGLMTTETLNALGVPAVQ